MLTLQDFQIHNELVVTFRIFLPICRDESVAIYSSTAEREGVIPHDVH